MGFVEVERNLGQLIAELARALRKADKDEQDRRLNNRLKRTIAGFLQDHQKATTRERGRLLIEEIGAALEDSEAGDRARLAVEKIRRDFLLDEDLTRPIDAFDEFRERIEGLRYEERLAPQDSQTLLPTRELNAGTDDAPDAIPLVAAPELAVTNGKAGGAAVAESQASAAT